MRGYFAIGVEGLSKALNAANLFRTAHAFGARFVFTVGATLTAREAMLDTSRTIESVPYYPWLTVEDMQLPKGCKLVGVELLGQRDRAAELPSSARRGLCAGRRARHAFARDARARGACGADPHFVLRQCGGGGRHRDV